MLHTNQSYLTDDGVVHRNVLNIQPVYNFIFSLPCVKNVLSLILLGGGLLYLHSYALYILYVHMRMRISFTAVETVAES